MTNSPLNKHSNFLCSIIYQTSFLSFPLRDSKFFFSLIFIPDLSMFMSVAWVTCSVKKKHCSQLRNPSSYSTYRKEREKRLNEKRLQRWRLHFICLIRMITQSVNAAAEAIYSLELFILMRKRDRRKRFENDVI